MTRNRESIDTSHGLDWGLWRVNVSAGAWYRLVTNYDPWLPDPASDPVCTCGVLLPAAWGSFGFENVSVPLPYRFPTPHHRMPSAARSQRRSSTRLGMQA